jgi:hypothetical protein
MWSVAAYTLNNQSRTAEEEWFSSFGSARRRKGTSHYEMAHKTKEFSGPCEQDAESLGLVEVGHFLTGIF